MGTQQFGLNYNDLIVALWNMVEHGNGGPNGQNNNNNNNTNNNNNNSSHHQSQQNVATLGSTVNQNNQPLPPQLVRDHVPQLRIINGINNTKNNGISSNPSTTSL